MEAAHALNSRLKFLQTAIHKLAVASPTIAATLGAERDLLLQSQDADLNMSTKEWRLYRQETCGACGNLMIPGWSSSVVPSETTSDGRIRKKEVTSNKRDTKGVIRSCHRCNRKTTLALDYRPPKHMKKPTLRKLDRVATTPDAPMSMSGTANAKTSATKPASASASSKQRAKARKGGLQAMLAQSKAQASSKSGLGLDLMDFMQ